MLFYVEDQENPVPYFVALGATNDSRSFPSIIRTKRVVSVQSFQLKVGHDTLALIQINGTKNIKFKSSVIST